LADEFRRRARTDWEYAQAIFDFVSNEIGICLESPHRRGVVETLERGYGMCLEKMHVLVALARAGGIPARYCSVSVKSESGGVMSLLQDDLGRFDFVNQIVERLAKEKDPQVRRIGAAFLGFISKRRTELKTREVAGASDSGWRVIPHPIVELQIGRVWIPADPTWGDEECVAYNFPLQRFGYQPIFLWKVMGTIISDRNEEIPFRMRRYIRWHILCLLARGLFDYANRGCEEDRARGRKLLAEIGREEYIRRRQYFYRRIPAVAELGVSLPPYPCS
jgi:hypothetical protein